jgi:PAS domain S-box-containing protein
MERHEDWEAVLGEADVAAFLTDPAGRITYLNRLAETLCGRTRADALGQPLRDVMRNRQEADEIELLNARLAAIVESSDDIIVSKTLDGIITSWNRGAEKVLGYTAAEAIGQHVSMLVPPESSEDPQIILNQVRRGQKVDHYLSKRRRKDGTIIDVSLTVSPIRNAAGEIVGASKVGRDVTETRQAGVIKDWLAAIVESSDDIIVSKTLDGIITSWNKGAERIFGYKAAEVVGKHVSMLMPPDHIEDTHRILSRIRRGEKVEHYETKRRCKDGRIIDVSLTVSPVRDMEGKIVGASKIGRDVTEQKRMEEERLEADRRKDEFLAMLAHELRNPLASISNAIQLFGKLETEDELLWAKDVIQRQVKHLSRLIDDLLDVSRITRGKISLKREALNLSPVVSSAVESVRPLLEERKHEMVVSLAPGALRIEGDPFRLEQVLVNLLTNAAKYTESGGRISLTARHEDGQIVVQVRDTGLGIPPELLPRVFELFVQGDRSMARSEGGLGIGLTLVQKLTEMHGGTVTATSEGAGLGSEFTLRFPAIQSTPAPKAHPHKELPRVARQSSRVLVVDDNLDTASGLAKLFKLLGHDVAIAHDGVSAVELARTHKPEVILLDIGLPKMNGYEVVRQLRQEPCCKTALIIAISGYGQEEDQRKSREAGFDHHLVKPVDFDALMTLIA